MTPSDSRDAAVTCRTADLIAIIPSMRALARCLCVDPSRADALARDSLVVAWERRAAIATSDAPTLWAFAIVCEVFRTSEGPPRRRVSSAAKLGLFREALAELPAERREVLALVVAAGLTHRTAAEVCGAAPAAITSRLRRARRELLGRLAEAGAARPPALAAA